MRPYVITTGAVFGLLTLAHVGRVIAEGPRVLNPWWIAITIASAVLCLWAARLAWPSKKG